MNPWLKPWRVWRLETMAIVFHRAREEVSEDPELHRLASQSAFARQLKESRAPYIAHALLRTRLACWAVGDHLAPFPRLVPVRARQPLERIGGLPAALRWALVRVWPNGSLGTGFGRRGGACCVVGLAMDVALRLPTASGPLDVFLVRLAIADIRTDYSRAALLY